MCEKEMITGTFKNVINKMSAEITHLIYMYKRDLALNDIQPRIQSNISHLFIYN